MEAPGGKFGPQLVHKPFSLVELKQIKAKLGSLSDNPTKCIQGFEYIVMAYEMTWKAITIILNQTLSDTDTEQVEREAKRFTDGLHLSGTKYPIGKTASPSIDPEWDYNQNTTERTPVG